MKKIINNKHENKTVNFSNINFCFVFAQDTTRIDNKWFTEFQVANSNGFNLDFFNGGDISIGRRFIKDIDLRLNFGYSHSKYESNYGIVIGSQSSESKSYSVSPGIDFLYRIKVYKDLLFKIGFGYQYKFRRSEKRRDSYF